MGKRIIWLLAVMFFAIGCSKPLPPRSGGRTADYWAEVLRQDDVELRRKAALKIGPLVLFDPVVMPALMEALNDSDPQVRMHAARSVGIYTGSKGVSAIPMLQDLKDRDPDEKVRQAAAKAIDRLTAEQK